MKRLLLLGILCLFGAFAHAQITRIEYFIDTEPGYGKAVSVPLDPDTEGFVNFNIPLQTVAEGFHNLFIRTQRNDGKWSHTDRRVFFVRKGVAVPKITKIRYSFKGEGAPDKVYEYLVSEPQPLIDISFFANLAELPHSRTYKIYLQALDENGFISKKDSAEFFVRPPILIEKVEVTNLACFGVNTGKALINATSVGLTLEYSLDNTTFKEGNTFENLAPGEYTAYARDKNDPSNKVQSTFTITSPTEVAITFSAVTPPTCATNSDGSVTVNATGGTAPYTYKLALQSTFQTSNILTVLPAGEVEIVVKDANGCEKTEKVTIAPPVPISIAFSATVSPTCAANSDGSVTVNATGGTSPYTYKLATQSTFQTSNILTGLPVGEVEIVVKDANSCEKTEKVTVGPPIPISITFSANVSPTCAANSDGSVTVNATGGTAPYTYKLASQSTFQTSNIVTGLPVGEVEIVVKDANGCEKTEKVTISPPIEIAVSFTGLIQPNCPADVSGGFTVSATGGSGGYKYKLSTQSNFQDAPQFQDLAAGTYTVAVKDGNGCEKSSTVEITSKSVNPAVPTISVQGRDGIDGTVSLVSSSATGNQWFVDGVEIPGATGQSLAITEPGNYQVRVTNAGGCSSISLTLNITSSPEIRTLKTKTYPNPSEGIVIIDLGKETQIDRVTIIHTTGAVMKTTSERMYTDKITLDLSPYNVGMYIIQVEGIGIFERIKIQKK